MCIIFLAVHCVLANSSTVASEIVQPSDFVKFVKFDIPIWRPAWISEPVKYASLKTT